jgi:hypothetical protein
VGNLVKQALRKFESLLEQFIAKVEAYNRSSGVPIMMWQAGDFWLDVQRTTSTMAGNIEGQMQASGPEWGGIAGGAYQAGVAGQAPAVQEVSALAGTTSGSATQIAVCGLGFYVAVLAAVIALVFAVATSPSGVGLVAGIVAAVVAVATAIGLFYLGVESQARVLRGLVAGNAAFPGGKWPLATTSS